MDIADIEDKINITVSSDGNPAGHADITDSHNPLHIAPFYEPEPPPPPPCDLQQYLAGFRAGSLALNARAQR
jgi:hypothetical protein